MKQLIAVIVACPVILFLPIPVKAELAEIRNPLWREVPGTFSEAFDHSAYVNANEIVRNGDIITYDVIDPNLGYNRVEANCRTNQFRVVRRGHLESRTRVNFTNTVVSSWTTAIEPYHQAVLSFVCTL